MKFTSRGTRESVVNGQRQMKTESHFIIVMATIVALWLPVTAAMAEGVMDPSDTVAVVSGYDARLIRLNSTDNEELDMLRTVLGLTKDALTNLSVLKTKVITEKRAADGVRLAAPNVKKEDEALVKFLVDQGFSQAITADVAQRMKDQWQVQLYSVKLDGYKNEDDVQEFGDHIYVQKNTGIPQMEMAVATEIRRYLAKFPSLQKPARKIYVTCIDKFRANLWSDDSLQRFLRELDERLTRGLHEVKDSLGKKYEVVGLITTEVERNCSTDQAGPPIPNNPYIDVAVSGFFGPSGVDKSSGNALLKVEVFIREFGADKLPNPIEFALPVGQQYQDKMKSEDYLETFVAGFKNKFRCSWLKKYGDTIPMGLACD